MEELTYTLSKLNNNNYELVIYMWGDAAHKWVGTHNEINKEFFNFGGVIINGEVNKEGVLSGNWHLLSHSHNIIDAI